MRPRVDVDRDGGDEDTTPTMTGRGETSARLAAWVFAVAILVAVPVIFHAAREQWFFLDEWDFLADRDLLSLDDLLRPHNEHWSTVPIISYRLVWQVVGLHHYWPYLVPTVAAHLTVAVLLRVVMRRAGVDPWIATAAAGLFAFYGTGWENIGWAFQIGFSGALASGIAAVLLADHDGGRPGRDAGAVAAAVVSLMCSGIGVVMLLAVGTTVMMRRGPRATVAVLAVPAAILGAWMLVHYQTSSGQQGGAAGLAVDIVLETARAIGPIAALGIVVTVGAVVGCIGRVSTIGWSRVRRELAAPGGLLVAATGFLALVAMGRGALVPEAQPRYLHVVAALVLPSVAIGLTELGRRWRAAGVVSVLLLAGALVPNIEAMGPAPFTAGSPDTAIALAHAAATLPDEDVRTVIDPVLRPGLDVPWLRSAIADGKVPDLDPSDRSSLAPLQLRLGFESLLEGVDGECQPLGPRGRVRVAAGDVLVVPAPTATVSVVDGVLPRGTSAELTPPPAAEPGSDGGPEVRLLRQGSPVTVEVTAAGARGPLLVCPA